MNLESALSLLEILAMLLMMAVNASVLRGRGDNKTAAFTEMQVDIKYIKEKIEGVEDVRDMATGASESAKSAHKRLDEHLRYDHHRDTPSHED